MKDSYHYYLVSTELDGDWSSVIISDGYCGDNINGESHYKFSGLSEAEVEEIESMTADDLYHYVHNNEGTIVK